MATVRYGFFSWVLLHNYFSIMVIYDGLGLWGCGLRFGFWGWGFQLMWFGACGMGISGYFWVQDLYTLYKHKRITLRKIGAYCAVRH